MENQIFYTISKNPILSHAFQSVNFRWRLPAWLRKLDAVRLSGANIGRIGSTIFTDLPEYCFDLVYDINTEM